MYNNEKHIGRIVAEIWANIGIWQCLKIGHFEEDFNIFRQRNESELKFLSQYAGDKHA